PHELADSEQRPARPRLVPFLRREVVEDLRQLLVRLRLARGERERLFVREREDELAPSAVLQLEHLGDLVATRRLPQLGRGEHGAEHLLSADRIDLLAYDLHHLLVYAPAERQERPEPGADLADESATYEQLV